MCGGGSTLASLRPGAGRRDHHDLARQLEDAYQEALSGGATEAEARRQAEHWHHRRLGTRSRLIRDLCGAQRLSPLGAWEARADDRVIATEGRLGPTAHLRQDAIYGLRTLRRSPGVTAIAVLSLALGIGANTAVFSVMNALILRPLPVSHPDQLIVVTDPTSSGMLSGVENGSRTFLSYHEFEGLRDHNAVCAGLLAFSSEAFTPPVTTAGPEPTRAAVALVSGNYFATLGLAARQGRVFGPEVDTGPGGHPVAVVSDAFWRQHLGADPAVVGRTIRIRQTPFAVVGIMPPAFTGLVVGETTSGHLGADHDAAGRRARGRLAHPTAGRGPPGRIPARRRPAPARCHARPGQRESQSGLPAGPVRRGVRSSSIRRAARASSTRTSTPRMRGTGCPSSETNTGSRSSS